MAPKQRSSRMKPLSYVVVDGRCTKDSSQNQQEHIIQLQKELDREREERTHVQEECDKFQAFWETSKKTAEEVQAELRTKNQEMKEAEERHHVEISVYKQKLKQVLLEQQNTASGKPDTLTVASVVQSQHTEPERDEQKDFQGLDGAHRKKFQETFLKELNLKHQVELMELTNEYERRIRELEVKNHEKMRSLMDTEEKKRKMVVNEMEKRMRIRVGDVKEEQERALRRADESYSTVHTKLLMDHNLLKKQLQEVQQENKHLAESLRDVQLKLPVLQTQLQQHTKKKSARSQAHLKLVEVELRELKTQHEVLLQAFKKVEQERDELLRSHQSQMLVLQQRRSQKEMQLQSKISSLTLTLQRVQQEPSVSASKTHSAGDTGGAAPEATETMDIR